MKKNPCPVYVQRGGPPTVAPAGLSEFLGVCVLRTLFQSHLGLTEMQIPGPHIVDMTYAGNGAQATAFDKYRECDSQKCENCHLQAEGKHVCRTPGSLLSCSPAGLSLPVSFCQRTEFRRSGHSTHPQQQGARAEPN